MLDKTPDGEDAVRFVEAYARYLNGYLPADGGLMDQTAAFEYLLPYVARLWNRHREVENEKALASAKRAGQSNVRR